MYSTFNFCMMTALIYGILNLSSHSVKYMPLESILILSRPGITPGPSKEVGAQENVLVDSPDHNYCVHSNHA